MGRSPARTVRARGIVFDLDGTLIDGYEGITTGVNAARAAFGLPPLTIDDVRGRVGSGLPHLMEDVLGKDRAVRGAEIFRETYDRVCLSQTRAVAGLSPALDALARRGIVLSVASNKPASYSNRILEALRIRDAFVAVLGPESAGAPKPDPRMIHACLAAMNLPAPDALYVGDMEIDAESGARAGVRVVLVSGGSTPRERLLALGPPVVASLAELLPLLA